MKTFIIFIKTFTHLKTFSKQFDNTIQNMITIDKINHMENIMKFTAAKDDFIAWLILDDAGKYKDAGYCRASQLSKAIPSERATMEIILISDDIFKVQNAFSWRLNEMGITPNHDKKAQKCRAVVCNETGEQFKSISDAARKNGGTVANISNHLARRIGYKSVMGKTYKYI